MIKKSDYKKQTSRAYDLIAKDVGIGFDEYFDECVKPEADYFLADLPSSALILDVGCGVGTHSLYFRQLGYAPLSIDISPMIIKICKDRGLNAMVMDLEKLDFEKSSFDAVWAHTSLLHLPKEKLPRVLTKLLDLLSSDGKIFIALRQGKSEGYEKYHDIADSDRWFAYYEKKEFDSLIPKGVEIMRYKQIFFKGRSFLNYHLRK